MKAILIIGILAVVCVVLFTTGVIAPRSSRRMQRQVDRAARKVERTSDRNAGRIGDATRDGVKKMRKAADRSGEAGRRLRSKIR